MTSLRREVSRVPPYVAQMIEIMEGQSIDVVAVGLTDSGVNTSIGAIDVREAHPNFVPRINEFIDIVFPEYAGRWAATVYVLDRVERSIHVAPPLERKDWYIIVSFPGLSVTATTLSFNHACIAPPQERGSQSSSPV